MCESKKIRVLSIFFYHDLYQFTRKTLLCIMTQRGNALSNMNFNDTEKYEIKRTLKKPT